MDDFLADLRRVLNASRQDGRSAFQTLERLVVEDGHGTRAVSGCARESVLLVPRRGKAPWMSALRASGKASAYAQGVYFQSRINQLYSETRISLNYP